MKVLDLGAGLLVFALIMALFHNERDAKVRASCKEIYGGG